MSLDKNDLKEIKSIVKDVVEDVVDKKIDEFAIMVNNSFTANEKRMAKMDKRFDKIENTLVDHSILLHRINQRTHNQQAQLDNHEKRLQTLEK